nr:hypothetical protein [Neisseria gonorrhoeae]
MVSTSLICNTIPPPPDLSESRQIRIPACAGMTGFKIAVLSGMTVRVFYCARPAPVNGGRLKMPSEGSDGIGIGESEAVAHAQ